MSELNAGGRGCELAVSDCVVFVMRLDPGGDLAY